MPAPTNRIPVRPARGERALLTASIDQIQEGEIVFARDEDALYVKDNGELVNVAVGTGIGDQIISAEVRWTIGLSAGNTAYTFTGQGFDGTISNPTIYLVRGQKYKFDHSLSTNPFRIETTNGEAYNNGITNNPAFQEVLSWEVSMQAPQRLRYSSTNDSSISGEIIVLSDTFSLGIQDLTDVASDEPLNGQALLYSSTRELWAPASLTTGGVTDLDSLTDVDTTGAIQDNVLKYNGQFWEAAPEAVDPGSAGRKSTASVTSSRTGLMVGTEFPLASESNWTSLGFVLAGGEGFGLEQFASFDSSIVQGWSPIGRTDSRTVSPGAVYFDGSGRVFGFGSLPYDFSPIASTKELSFPQNGSFGMTAFLSTTTTISRAGVKSNHQEQGYSWEVLRVEYSNGFGGLIAIEYWFSLSGHFKMLYGRPTGGFTFDAGVNKNGFVFASRSGDSTLGEINNTLPGLTGEGDYSIEVWYNGSGYNLEDLANVADSDTNPPRQGFPLVWNEDSWQVGSIVRDGSQASTSGGDLGIFAVDELYLYVCVGKNQWKRIPLESFT